MAREAGGLNCDCCLPEPEPHEMQEFIERFAALVAAHEQEECAKACDATEQETDAYGYASRLAVALWEQHYKDVAPQWKPLDDLMGVLTQIDNMTSGLTRLAQQIRARGEA
jgi:hypothetical protein